MHIDWITQNNLIYIHVHEDMTSGKVLLKT